MLSRKYGPELRREIKRHLRSPQWADFRRSLDAAESLLSIISDTPDLPPFEDGIALCLRMCDSMRSELRHCVSLERRFLAVFAPRWLQRAAAMLDAFELITDSLRRPTVPSISTARSAARLAVAELTRLNSEQRLEENPGDR